MRFLILMLLSASLYAGPYVGTSITYDNDTGFCSYKSVDDYCTTLQAFAGFDGAITDSVYYDLNITYEDQLDGDTDYNPASASFTLMKRW